MSFTSLVRDELARVEVEGIPAQKAELIAIVRLMGTIGGTKGKHRVEIATESAPIARRVIRLAHLSYSLKTELTTRRSMLHKTNNYLITIPAQPGLQKLLTEGGLFGGDNHTFGIPPKLVFEDGAATAYLRGAFLATGFMADPKGDFHFELSVHNEVLAQEIQKLMMRFEIEPKIIVRRGSWTVYLKGADHIINFLALVGAHSALLEAEGERVYKSIRSDINRKVNAEIANQAKATRSALDQLESIRLIAQHGDGLDSLPPALREFAELRMNNPELSLSELGEQAKPKLSKSAVNHRMRRIMAIAKKIRES